MFQLLNRLHRALSARRAATKRLAAAVLETLEERRMLSLTVNHHPYLQMGDAALGAANDQMEIMWQALETVDNVTSTFTVEYRVATPGAIWSAPQPPTARLDLTVEPRENYNFVLTGLNYNTEYEYRVCHYDQPVGGPVQLIEPFQRTFRTRLDHNDTAPFTFVAYGDSGALFDPVRQNFSNVVSRIDQIDPAFTLLLGDAVNGLTDQKDRNGSQLAYDSRFDQAINAASVEYIADHVDYLAFGNHDILQNDEGGDGGVASELNWSSPRYPVLTGAGEPVERTYCFDYGNARFITFDSNAFDNAARLDVLMPWVQARLIEEGAPDWKIVFVHYPIISAGGNAGGNYYQNAMDHLIAAGADLLLNGHVHNYQRSLPLIGRDGTTPQFLTDDNHLNLYAPNHEPASTRNIIQVIAGIGGRAMDNAGAPTWLASNLPNENIAPENGFLKIDVTTDALTVKYIGALTGRVYDMFSLGHDVQGPVATLDAALDNTAMDLDDEVGQAIVPTEQPSFRVNVADTVGAALTWNTVVTNAVTLERNGELLHQGSNDDYTFQIDPNGGAAGGWFQLNAVGGNFGTGIYQITVGQNTAITDASTNAMDPVTFTIEIDTYLTVRTFEQGQNGYAGCQDTWIQGNATYADATDRSALDTLRIDGEHTLSGRNLQEQGLVRFDNIIGPAAVPAGSSVISATLTLHTIDVDNAYTADGILVYRFIPEVIWNDDAVWNTFPNAGGGIQVGEEVLNPPDATVTTATKRNQDINIDVWGTLQAWADGDTNRGWAILDPLTDAWVVDSANAAANRPTLTVRCEHPDLIVTFVAGALQIVGTSGDDSISVAADFGTYQVTLNGVPLEVGGNAVMAGSVTSLEIIGRAGNDTINIAYVCTACAFPTALATHIRVDGGSGNDSIIGSEFADRLVGMTGNDTLVGMAGNDTLDAGDGIDLAEYNVGGTGAINATVSTGTGAGQDGFGATDTYDGVENLSGSPQGDTLTGDDNANTLWGNDGQDSIWGGGANDLIYGGADHDNAYGGLGDDTLYGEAGTDTLYGGDIAYIDSGDGNDMLVGGDDGDSYRWPGNNQGDDYVVEDPNDAGVDDFYFYYFTVGVTVNLGSTARQDLGTTGHLTISDAQSIENACGAYGPDDNLTGNGLNNSLYGGGGNDTLSGMAGNDTLCGYVGNDSMVGGSDSDTYLWLGDNRGRDTVREIPSDPGRDVLDFYQFHYGAVDVDIRQTYEQPLPPYPTPPNDPENSVTIVNANSVEDINGTLWYDDRLIGDDRANILTANSIRTTILGNGGNDTIIGSAYADSLDGGLGNDSISGAGENDTLIGGGGNDTLNGGAGTDTASYSTSTAQVTASLLTGVATDGMGGTDSLSSIEVVIGGSAGDSLTGGNGNDCLVGNGGNDTLVGNGGNDTLEGSGGNDTYYFSGSGLGSDSIVEAANADTDTLDFSALSGVTVHLNYTTLQTIVSGVLQLTLSNALGLEDVKGTSAADSIYANDRPNHLWGYGGNDVLIGYGGNDSLYGSDGNDNCYGGSGNDSIDAGIGDDYLWGDYGNPNEGSSGSDTLYGGSGNDTLWGDNYNANYSDVANDSIDCGDGNDVAYGDRASGTGLGGNDTIVGYGGNDTLYGEEGDDRVYGDTTGTSSSTGNDYLTGGGGADILWGDDPRYGASYPGGNDYLAGGTGNDTLYGDGDWSGSGMTNGGRDTVCGNENNDYCYGGYGDDYVYGGADNDYLWGGYGNDYLDAETGSDYVDGADGNDTLYSADATSDTIYGGNGTDRILAWDGIDSISGVEVWG